MDSFETDRRVPDPGGAATPTDRVRQGVRQGVISGRVLTVLITSVALAAAALFIAWVIFK